MSDSSWPQDYSSPGPSVHGNFQARILEWVAIPFSRASSRPRDWTWVSYIAGRFFIVWATREDQMLHTCAWFLSSCFFQTLLLQLVQIIACSLKKKKKNYWSRVGLQCCIKVCFLFCFGFWLCHKACGILVPQPGIEAGPTEVTTVSLNHWTTREFPIVCFNISLWITTSPFLNAKLIKNAVPFIRMVDVYGN